MTEFQRALDQYLEGELDDDSLDAALRKTLIAAPDAAGELEKTVRDLRDEERVTERLYATLMTQVRDRTAPGAASPDPTLARTAAGAAAPGPAGPVQSPESMIGAVFRERFILESEIGHGGMGIVYCARDLRREEAGDLSNKVAIKVLAGNIRDDPDAYIALQREAKRAQQLAHPNIATVYDFDREGDIAYLCMELLKGRPLDEFLATTAARGLPFEEALPIIQGMANGLAYAHERGIVHADFKPNNVFLTDKGVVKILDFGIARVVARPDRTALTVFDAGRLGAMTPSYASCEMFDRQDPDPRDDMYALACVAYELLTGTHPFSSIAAPQARASNLEPRPITGLNSRQNRALQHGLAFARADRTPSVESFMEELTAPRNPAPGRLIGSISAAALALAVGTGAWLFLTDGSPPSAPTAPETAPETATAASDDQVPASDGQPPAPASNAPAAAPEQPAPGEAAGEAEVASLPATEQPVAAVDEETRAKIDRILEVAKLHLASGRLVEPPGSNAAEAFAAIVELQPGNRDSRDGLEAVAAGIEKRASELAQKDAADEALEMVNRGLEWIPGHPALTRLRDELASR